MQAGFGHFLRLDHRLLRKKSPYMQNHSKTSQSMDDKEGRNPGINPISYLPAFLTESGLLGTAEGFASGSATIQSSNHPIIHPSQIIQRAGDLPAHRFGQFCINFRRPHICMAEELLNATDIDSP
jgi:hypothetical protein